MSHSVSLVFKRNEHRILGALYPRVHLLQTLLHSLIIRLQTTLIGNNITDILPSLHASQQPISERARVERSTEHRAVNQPARRASSVALAAQAH